MRVCFQVNVGARQAAKGSDVIRSRKGVVKMLIASVTVYIISYAPVQIPVFYNLVSATPFRTNWTFLVLVMTLTYINSAVNPIIYSVFCHNFRYLFRRLLCAVCSRRQTDKTAEVVTVVTGRRHVHRHVKTLSSRSQAFRMKQHAASSATDDVADDRINSHH